MTSRSPSGSRTSRSCPRVGGRACRTRAASASSSTGSSSRTSRRTNRRISPTCRTGTHGHYAARGRRGPAGEPGRLGLDELPRRRRAEGGTDPGPQPLSVDGAARPGSRHRRRPVRPRLEAEAMRRPRAPRRRNGSMHPRSTVVSLLLFACLSAFSLSSSSARAATPSLAIVSPADGAIAANGTPVIVRFLVSDFMFVQPGRLGQVVAPNEGHLNVLVDGALGRVLVQIEPIVLPLASGPHTILLRLVGNDGAPLTPDVSASLRVVATQGPAGSIPTVGIVSPKPDERTGHGVYISFQVSNFTLVEPHGQANAPNEGHLQMILDGSVMEELAQYEPGFLVSVPDGDHVLTMRLANNDDTPLSPDVSASITFHVTASTSATLPLVLNGGVLFLEVFVLIILILRRRKAEVRTPLPPRDEL